jgi:CheY-like chemotaxis protein
MDGDQVLELLRRRGFHTPVVIVTAYAPDVGREVFGNSVTAVIDKTVDLDELLKILRSATE